MNDLKFFIGQSSNWSSIVKDANSFYLVINDDNTIDLYLGDVLLSKGSIVNELAAEIARAKAAEEANAAAIADNSAAIADEVARAQTEEGKLNLKIEESASELLAAISEEASRAIAAEEANAAAILVNAEAIAVEIERAKAAEEANAADIETLNGEADVEGSVKNIVVQAVSEVVAEAPEAFDTLKEIADYIASDKTGAAEMSNAIAANKKAIEDEVVRALAAEEVNAAAIDANAAAIVVEKERALAAEEVNAAAIADNAAAIVAEKERAEAAEKVNADAIAANAANLVVEENRAIAAEEANAAAIAAEEERALAAEKDNADAIVAEKERALAAEKVNADAIAAEEERALAAEKVNADAISELDTELTNEIAQRKGLKGEGNVSVSIDAETGLQTIKLVWQEF